MVPYCTLSRHLPAGAVVQDVLLVHRSDMQPDDGLVLPLANCVPDLEGYDATPAEPAFAGWFPTRTHDWNVIPNGDGSTTLYVRVYPLLYNRTTTEVRFWRRFTLELRTVASPVYIQTARTDKLAYEAGETIACSLSFASAGDPVDAVVHAVVRRYGTDEKLAGLLLKGLDALTGSAAFTPRWDSANAEPGLCYVDVIVADMTGRTLDRRTAPFRLDAPAAGQ
jgi:hypothetical protein